MNGCILQGTSIAIDLWNIRGRKNCFTHFLSHVHGDHVVGLSSTWMQSIYCSAVTAEILYNHYGISKSLLHHLPLNQPVTISQPHSKRTFCVTAFDANHCPGALMFYFQGDFGNIFHTGDFRYSSDIAGHVAGLHGKIDILYIDNTFCSPSCQFPPREECLSQIIDVVRQHPDHEIIIGVRKLGKESMLVDLGLALNETICVSYERLKIIQYLYSTNIFCTLSNAKEHNCRIKTVPFHQVSSAFIDKLNETTPTLAILPSAIFTGLPSKPFSRKPNIHVIPFSDHSSFTELIAFVSQLKPTHIIPIVNNKRGPFGIDISDRLDMTCFEPSVNPQTPALYDKNCIVGKSVADETVLENASLLNSNNDGGLSCLFSQLPDSSSEIRFNRKLYGVKRETHNHSLSSCNSKVLHHVQRKKSIHLCKRRRLARGVCYTDDHLTFNENPISNAGKPDKHIPSVFEFNQSASTKYGSGTDESEDRRNGNEIGLSKDENNKLNGRLRSNEHYASDIEQESDLCISHEDQKKSKHFHLKSIPEDQSYSFETTQTSDACLKRRHLCGNSVLKDNIQLKCDKIEQQCHFCGRSKSRENVALKSCSNISDDGFIDTKDKFDILSYFDKRKRKRCGRHGNTTNRSLILSLKSVISK